MNRRDFLKYSALMTAAAASPALFACDAAGGSPYYVKPQPLVLSGEKLLLTNGMIIDVVRGNIAKGDLLLQNGRITDVFYGPSNNIHADGTVDLQGAYVCPGLINAHCHMTLPCTVSGIGKGLLRTAVRQMARNAEECVKHGVTTVRDMAALGAQLHDLKADIASGRVVGPRIISSYALDVPLGYMTSMVALFGLIDDPRYFAIVRNQRDAIQGVMRAAEENAGLVKIAHQAEPFADILPNPRQMDLETTALICGEASKTGLPVALHHTDTEGLFKGMEAGVATFEHMVCDRALTQAELQRFKASGAMIIPTASVGYAISWETNLYNQGWDQGVKAQIVAARAKYLVDFAHEYCEAPIAAAIEQEYYNYCNPDYFDRRHLSITVNMDATDTILDIGVDNLLRYYDAGIPMGCGNDGGIPFDFPGAIGLEMAILERSGIDPMDILRMATLNNAKVLGMEADLGSIEAGKIADLAIFAKNPLDNFENAFRPVMVFQNGELAYRG